MRSAIRRRARLEADWIGVVAHALPLADRHPPSEAAADFLHDRSPSIELVGGDSSGYTCDVSRAARDFLHTLGDSAEAIGSHFAGLARSGDGAVPLLVPVFGRTRTVADLAVMSERLGLGLSRLVAAMNTFVRLSDAADAETATSMAARRRGWPRLFLCEEPLAAALDSEVLASLQPEMVRLLIALKKAGGEVAFMSYKSLGLGRDPNKTASLKRKMVVMCPQLDPLVFGKRGQSGGMRFLNVQVDIVDHASLNEIIRQ